MLNICGIDKYLLINDDCFSALKDIPDHSIDLILTDPPYNIAKYSTGNLKNNRKYIGIEIDKKYMDATEKRLSSM